MGSPDLELIIDLPGYLSYLTSVMPRRILLRQFQELDPNTPEEVHNIWLTVHLLCMSTSAVNGAITAYWFGLCLEEFDFNCFLFAKFFVHEWKNDQNFTDIQLDNWDSIASNSNGEELKYHAAKWGGNKSCDSVQFLHICSMLSAIIWLIFLILPSRDKTRESQIFEKPHRLMLPMLVWSSIYSCVIIGANSTLFSGLEGLCFILKTSHKDSGDSLCLTLQKQPYQIFFGKKGEKIFQFLAIVKAAAVVGCISWIVNVCWTLLRMYLLIDYKVYMVRIWKFVPDSSKRRRSK